MINELKEWASRAFKSGEDFWVPEERPKIWMRPKEASFQSADNRTRELCSAEPGASKTALPWWETQREEP